MSIYIDTSAPLKWYVTEVGSGAFDLFMLSAIEPLAARLAVIELRCTLARRRRAGTFSAAYEAQAYQRFLVQISEQELLIVPLQDVYAIEGMLLMFRLGEVARRAADAMHRGAAVTLRTAELTTADRVTAEAAARLGMQVHVFGAAASSRG